MRGLLRRIGVALLSVVVVLVMLVGDLLHFVSRVLRSVLPADLDEFFKRQSALGVFLILTVAAAIWAALHIYEGLSFLHGHFFRGAALFIVSKVYFVVVLSYFGQIYADRLLAIGWIRRSYEWYLGWRDYIRSLAWYQAAGRFISAIKEKFKSFRH